MVSYKIFIRDSPPEHSPAHHRVLLYLFRRAEILYLSYAPLVAFNPRDIYVDDSYTKWKLCRPKSYECVYFYKWK